MSVYIRICVYIYNLSLFIYVHVYISSHVYVGSRRYCDHGFLLKANRQKLGRCRSHIWAPAVPGARLVLPATYCKLREIKGGHMQEGLTISEPGLP